jgi:hypothetical protein
MRVISTYKVHRLLNRPSAEKIIRRWREKIEILMGGVELSVVAKTHVELEPRFEVNNSEIQRLKPFELGLSGENKEEVLSFGVEYLHCNHDAVSKFLGYSLIAELSWR